MTSAPKITGPVNVKLVAVPAVAKSISLLIVIDVDASIHTAPTTAAKVDGATVKVAAPPDPQSISAYRSVPPVWMTTSAGSKSQRPDCPKEAPVSTLPICTPKLILPEVSTKPPFPPNSPPLAKICPLKRVVSSAQRITLPPSPLVMASALITDVSSMTFVRALRRDPSPLYSPPIKTEPPERSPEASMLAPINLM